MYRRAFASLSALAVVVATMAYGVGSGAPSLAHARTTSASAVAAAKAFVRNAEKPYSVWDGPTTGPKIAPGMFVVVVSADQKNDADRLHAAGFVAAARVAGWRVKVLDGQGSVSVEAGAIDQAIALKPNGIDLDGVDAVAEQSAISRAAKHHIVLVGFHTTPYPGPAPALHIFANFATNPASIGKATADYAIADSNGQANVAIIYDALYAIARVKAQHIESEIRACSTCKVFDYANVPLADVQTRGPQYITAVVQKYGKKLNYVLSIADFYFDFMAPTLKTDGVPTSQIQLIGADGTKEAYQRISSGDYQTATVPEPEDLFAWQAVDELNRAFHHMGWSGYVPRIHIVYKGNVNQEGGSSDEWIPSNHYQQHYRQLWGK